MIEKTLIVVGPGGVGKSPLDALFKTDIKIDPYRLRSSGPRDSNDIFYVHPKLRNELHSVLENLGDKQKTKDGVEWFPKSKVLFFKVREEWQLLIFAGLEGNLAKAEIYAPVLPAILSISNIKNLLGEVQIVVLNPASESLTEMQDWSELEAKTRHNCTKRGDSRTSVEKRVKSISEEAPVWKRLIVEYGATEYYPWGYPEYLYKTPGAGTDLVKHQRQILREARQCLLEANPNVEDFLKTDDEIDQIAEPFVK